MQTIRAPLKQLDTPPARPTRRKVPLLAASPVSYATRCAIVVLVAAIALRFAFSIASNAALSHPDEHQQYLEQAVVHAYGYGVTFWEQDRHMRHPLFVSALGRMIRGMDAIGLHDPAQQAIVLRMTLGLASLAAILAWAWRWHRAGETPAAVFLLSIMVVSLDVLWIQSRVLSDNAVAAPLLLALLCERRWPTIAGLLLAILFAVRFQAGFWIAPAVVTLAVSQWLDWRRERSGSLVQAMRPMLLLSGGFLAGSAVLLGGEWIMDGRCSPWEYWRASVSESGAAQFGVSPWYFYLGYGTRDLLRASVLLPIALWFGARRELRLAVCAFVFLLTHSLIDHKEVRLLWTLMPVACLLAARGFGEIWKQSPRRGVWAVAIVLSFAVPSLVRVPFFRWRADDYAATNRALDFVAKQDDVTGVVVLGVPDYRCGNHFYFRRDLPLVQGPQRSTAGDSRRPFVIGDDPDEVVARAERKASRPNYWVVADSCVGKLPDGRFEAIGRFGELNVFRRDR